MNNKGRKNEKMLNKMNLTKMNNIRKQLIATKRAVQKDN